MVEGRGEAFVKVWLDTLDRADDGNMWDPLEGEVARDRWCRYTQVIPSSAPRSADVVVG